MRTLSRSQLKEKFMSTNHHYITENRREFKSCV